MAILPRAHKRRIRSFMAVSPSHGIQSCPAGRGSWSSRSSFPTDALSDAAVRTRSAKSSGTKRSLTQGGLDRLSDLDANRLHGLDMKFALSGVGKIPAMQTDRKTIKPFLQNIAQLALIFCVKFSVLRTLIAPFKRFHLRASQDQHIAIIEDWGRSGSRQ